MVGALAPSPHSQSHSVGEQRYSPWGSTYRCQHRTHQQTIWFLHCAPTEMPSWEAPSIHTEKSLLIPRNFQDKHKFIQILKFVCNICVCINACTHTNTGIYTECLWKDTWEICNICYLGKTTWSVGGKRCKGHSLFIVFVSGLCVCVCVCVFVFLMRPTLGFGASISFLFFKILFIYF